VTDSAGAALVFHASGTEGFLPAVQEAPQRVHARKRAVEVQVTFARHDGLVSTLEGAVHAHAGDAIVTGPGGERWPVRRARFLGKYRAVPPLAPWSPGTYLRLPVEVLALRIAVPFAVVLSDGCSRLFGRPGDWLVDYGDGNLGVVASHIFAATYDILGAS
jgi:hypothetical protein